MKLTREQWTLVFDFLFTLLFQYLCMLLFFVWIGAPWWVVLPIAHYEMYRWLMLKRPK